MFHFVLKLNGEILRGVSMGVYENMIQNKADELDWSTVFVSTVASKFGIPGASEASLSKAFNRTKELPTAQTALPLDQLLGRFLKMCEAFKPFTLRLDDPEQAKQLLEDFESGNLTVAVTRQEPGALIYPVFVIENLIERNKLFEGIQNSEPRWGIEGTPIRDRAIADAAVKVLKEMGHSCHVLSIRIRTVETKIAKTLRELGFVFNERDNNGTDS
jgi:hypothetical protein